jgi:rhamnulokinase
MQAIGLKHLGSLAEARDIVRTSFVPEVYEPKPSTEWDDAYARLQKVMK